MQCGPGMGGYRLNILAFGKCLFSIATLQALCSRTAAALLLQLNKKKCSGQQQMTTVQLAGVGEVEGAEGEEEQLQQPRRTRALPPAVLLPPKARVRARGKLTTWREAQHSKQSLHSTF